MTNNNGFFGRFGGSFIPSNLQAEMDKINKAYNLLRQDKNFIAEIEYIRKTYQGRPTPITFAKNLTQKVGGAKIFLKREDLNYTGAHKLNHCIGEALLAKHLGKTKVIAETGAGQHGVALATAAAYLGLECDIYMGEVDIAKEYPNVIKMKLLGAKVVPVSHGQKSLKEAVDSAFEAYLKNSDNSLYCIGSVVGPHPFPSMVRDFQEIIGIESRKQILELDGALPNAVIACVGGGSNAIGIFSGFLDDKNVELYGVEPLGKDSKLGNHSASITYGKEAILHGYNSLVLQDDNGNPAPVYSIASGLSYPSVGPEHAYLHSINRVKYVCVDDNDCLNAFFELAKTDGIIPALESAHAVAYGIKLAQKLDKEKSILINLSGRGDKDIDFVINNYNPTL